MKADRRRGGTVRVACAVAALGLFMVSAVQAQTIFTKVTNGIESASNAGGTYGRIPLGTSGGDVTHTAYSAVLKDGGTYWMWYSGHDGSYWRIYCATSSDAVAWTKVNNAILAASDAGGSNGRIPLGSTGRGDSHGTLQCAVIKDGSVFKMWYTGYNNSNYRIYYATSSNGLTWTKYDNTVPSASNTSSTNGRVPLGSSGGDITHVMKPTVVKDGNTYRMWYLGYNAANYRVYAATSPDGLTWTKVDNTVPAASDTTSTGGRIPLGTNGKNDDGHTGHPGVWFEPGAGVHRVWYSGHDGANWTSIHLATSPNGSDMTKINNVWPGRTDTSSTDGRVPLGATAGRGDYNYAFGPTVLRDGALYRMFYVGYNGANYRIFAATAPADHPTVSNRTAQSIGATTASLVGTMVSTGMAASTLRVYWGTNDGEFVRTQWKGTGTVGVVAAGIYTNNVSGLSPLTRYYYRFYATNSAGVDWADEAGTFDTYSSGLMVSSRVATAVGVTNATLHGRIMGTGGGPNPRVWFCLDYTDRGTGGTASWLRVIHMGTGTGLGDTFATNLTDLISGSNYFYRCYVTNSTGTDWSDEVRSFSTIHKPVLSNPGAAGVRGSAVWLRGTVTDAGGQTPSARFQYWPGSGGGTTTVAMGLQDGSFSNWVSGLDASSAYAYRVLASNDAGISISTTQTFNTLSAIYVALSGDNSDGTTWAKAYNRLHTAVAAAADGDAIYIKYGTYSITNQVVVSGKRSLRIRGGYAGTTPEPGVLTNAATILNRNTVISRVFYGSGSTVTVERLRIQGGYLNTSGSKGGALHFVGGSEVILRDCILTNNQCYAAGANEGGALYMDGGRLTVENCHFIKNALNKANWDTQSRGGGASVRNAISVWSNVSFFANTVWTRHQANHGGALFLSGGQATLTGCVFSNNYSTSEGNGDAGPTLGGALHADGVAPLLVEDTFFTKNRLAVTSGGGARQGGALYVGGAAANAVLRRCVFTGNGDGAEENGDIAIGAGSLAMTNVLVVRSAGGSGLYVAGGTARAMQCTFATNVLYGVYRVAGSVEVLNSIAWLNVSGGISGADTVSFTCSQDTQTGQGNLQVDPQFVDRTFFHLRARAGCYANGFFSGGSWTTATNDSPLIDAANPTSDYSGEPQPYGFRANLGAYGNSATASKTYLEDPGVFAVLTAYAHPALALTTNSARLRGQVLNTGGENPIAYLCWGPADGGTATSGWANVVNLGVRGEWEFLNHDLVGLASGVTYRYRTYLTNSTATDWSSLRAFSAAGVPVLTNLGPYRIQRTAVRLQGNVLSDGGSTPTAWFRWWQDGSATTTTVAMGEQIATFPFLATVTGLTANTLYYYRVDASNSVGISQSSPVGFTTLSTAPIERYVTPLGAGIMDGSSWEDAYLGMDGAMEDCTYPGDTIHVKNGTYARSVAINLSGYPGLTIHGGYAGTGTPGALSGSPSIFTRQSGYNVRIFYGNAATVTLSRLTIEGGYLNTASADGGGLYFMGNSVVVLTNCVVQRNMLYATGTTAEEGGGLYQSGGRLTVVDSTFYTNRCAKVDWSTSCHGAGLAAVNANVLIRNSRFQGNYMTCRHYDLFGAAVYLAGGTATVEGCIFTNNYSYGEGESGPSASVYGGAIHAASVKQVTITDSSFHNNLVRTFGAGKGRGACLYLTGTTGTLSRVVMKGEGHANNGRGVVYIESGRLWMTNTLIVQAVGESGIYSAAGILGIDNTTLAGNAQNGVSNGAATATIRNSILWGNTAGGIGGNATVTYSCVQGGVAGTGNISADPLFADTIYYHLQSPAGYYAGGYFSGGDWAYALEKSPCVDAGDRSSPFLLEPAPNGGRANQGAYGNTGVASRSLAGGSIFLFR